MDGLSKMVLGDALDEQVELINKFVEGAYIGKSSLEVAESRACALMHEATEVSELLYKSNLYLRPLDIEHLKAELGDVIFNVNAVAVAMGFTLESCISASNDTVRQKQLKTSSGMSDQIHYFAFNFAGWSAHENLGDCIDRQLQANQGCYAVMRVLAPIKATYSITRHLPDKYYDTSVFMPGEQVSFTPVAAPHGEVAEDYRATCKDTTDWSVEKWREYANELLVLEEAAQSEAQAPVISQCEFHGFTYPVRKLKMPDGTVWKVSNETTMKRPDLPVTVDGQIAYYFPDDVFNDRSDSELLDEIGDCT